MDELNIVEGGKNYGHPLVIGSNDGNYNNAAAGASNDAGLPGAHNSSAPLITNENTNATAIGAANFRAPIKTLYSPSNADLILTFDSVINQNIGNANWPSEGVASIDVYTANAIPNGIEIRTEKIIVQ